MKRGLIGQKHVCGTCGYEVLLGPGHHMDLAVCASCGADFYVDYPAVDDFAKLPRHFQFSHCAADTPGTLIWSDSDELKAYNRDNPVVVRRDVQPLPGTELPDLRNDVCPKCRSKGSLVLRLSKQCPCPKCHTGVLKRVGSWIQ